MAGSKETDELIPRSRHDNDDDEGVQAAAAAYEASAWSSSPVWEGMSCFLSLMKGVTRMNDPGWLMRARGLRSEKAKRQGGILRCLI